ncbi:MAG: DinB family protein [Bacteroidetes bacterium]|nr:DinB family protein [Bacteroidota bacterium]
MSSTLSGHIARLDDQRGAFVEALDALPPRLRTLKPSPEAWSPVEIAEHVYRSERAVLRGLERQLDPEGERRELGKPSRAKFLALMVALRSPKKFKVPEGVSTTAPAGMTYEEIHEGWLSFPTQWEAILGSTPEDLLNVGLIRHPISGPMTLSQSAQFLAVHTARHFKQLERTLKVLK